MDFFQVDVFTEKPYAGNMLAVYPDAPDLSTEQMQKIAREMNLSETTFVSNIDKDSYDVRIFTPVEELPFAGHPTIGTAWLLRREGLLKGERVTQRSKAGPTSIVVEGDKLWFTREGGTSQPDLGSRDERAVKKVAAALRLDEGDIGFEARELGRTGRLQPAFAEAGLLHFIVPVRDVEALGRVSVREDELKTLDAPGAYCIAPYRAGGLRARGFFPGYGIIEDPGTGSAAAALGPYLADRVGDIDLEVVQGVEMERPCRIGLRARAGVVQVGGACRLSATGRLDALP